MTRCRFSIPTHELDVDFRLIDQIFGPEHLDVLDPDDREQFLEAAHASTGVTFGSPGEWATYTAETYNDKPELYGVDLYAIAAGERTWWLWHFPDTDDGVVFVSHDTLERVPVVLVGDVFEVWDGRRGGPDHDAAERARIEALAEALTAGFDNRRLGP